ncbi:MAG: L-2-amino-thiazoline-4-carboxylic acid hydrolase [Anaerolineae bacterium]
MDDSRAADRFTARHHALLFAWMTREAIEQVGEERGKAVIRKAVRRYGEERGHRMGLRAEADGEPRSMANYLAYGEWAADPAESEQAVAQEGTDLQMTVLRCPWDAAWAENDLRVYGRLYCLEIDEALVRGFNPVLKLDVNATRPNDAEPCQFVFHDVAQRGPRRGQVMSWAYHLGHLFKTVCDVMAEELGAAGQEAADRALAAFAERYGEEAAEVVLGYGDVDFGRLAE